MKSIRDAFVGLVLGTVLLAAPALCFYLKSEFHELDRDAERVISHRYVVHLPAGYRGDFPLPVVLTFHGRGGFPATVARQSQMNLLADKYRFMAVYPEGSGQPSDGSFNAGRCCGYAAQRRVDDVGFVRDILDDLEKNYRIDRQRVYATGMSNGASMAFRLACELSDRIAAIGPVSGNQGVDGPVPRRPVPVICFYGMRDPYMPPSVMQATILWWLRVNHCRAKPVEVITKSDYSVERYEPVRGQRGAPVVFYKITKGGHTWPGGIDINKGPGAGLTIATVAASEIMWQFFARHPLVTEEEIISNGPGRNSYLAGKQT
jgi:polyhydroxybutyrate depolymerase